MAKTMQAAARLECEPTHYVNVDLDILSSVPLDTLVQAMGEETFVLYVGGERRKYEAHLELASSHDMSADQTIIALTRLIQRLPRRHRKVWDSAKSRAFNVGIGAGLEPHGFELLLQRRTLEAICAVDGALVVTVYAPDVHEAKLARRSRSRS